MTDPYQHRGRRARLRYTLSRIAIIVGITLLIFLFFLAVV